jgi:putative thioredoxin
MSQQIPARFAGGAVDLSHLAARAQQPAASPSTQPGGAGGQVVDVPSLVFAIGDQSFEQAAQLSSVVPVVIALLAAEDPASAQLAPVLEAAVREHKGRLVLAQVEATANPGLMQAFQVQAVPTVVALVAGRPVPLFQGPTVAEQIQDLFTQLLQLCEQQGVNGRVNAPDTDAAQSAPAEPAVNPAHAAALEALESGDFATAVHAYEQVLVKAPADHEARAALVQARLLLRLQGASADEIRMAAAAGPNDVDAQMRVADLDLSGGHIEDAFLRLLDLFAASDAETRPQIRERLLELFEVVGQADPRVAAARARLANLLY